MELRLITEVEDLQGKTVIIRASCNVPLVDGVVRNSFRLKRALPTLTYLREKGAKTIIVSHIGREVDETLRPVFDELSQTLPLTWGGTITDPAFSEIKNAMQDGDIVLVTLHRHRCRLC